MVATFAPLGPSAEALMICGLALGASSWAAAASLEHTPAVVAERVAVVELEGPRWPPSLHEQAQP